MTSMSLRAALCHEERMEGHTGLDSPHWPWGQWLVTQHLEPGRLRLLGRGLRDGPDPRHLWLSSLETQLGVPWASLIRQFQVRSLKQDWGKFWFEVTVEKEALTCIASCRSQEGLAKSGGMAQDVPVKPVCEWSGGLAGLRVQAGA